MAESPRADDGIPAYCNHGRGRSTSNIYNPHGGHAGSPRHGTRHAVTRPHLPGTLVSHPSKGWFPELGVFRDPLYRLMCAGHWNKKIRPKGVRSCRARYPGDSLGTHPAAVFRRMPSPRSHGRDLSWPRKTITPSSTQRLRRRRRPRYYRFQLRNFPTSFYI